MKNNVIWILVDGIRNYQSTDSESIPSDLPPHIHDIGQMGLLPIMKEIGEDSIFFNQAICSATSTAMSISSQMTGIPSYYLSRSFDDFKFDNSEFDNLGSILKNNGYNVYGLSFAIDVRIKFKGIIDHIGKEFWPKGINKYKAWNNDAVFEMINNLLNHGMEQPFFLFIHLNGRFDPEISNKVKEITSKLMGNYNDSILIMNSDHGMPDPHIDRSYFYYKWLINNNIPLNRHDLIMTDDNILIPLIINYPDCPNKIIDVPVGAIDIFHTILDLLNIKYKNKFTGSYVGKSLVPLINENNKDEYLLRKFRTDARYIAQDGNITSIRGYNFKYVNSKKPYGELDNEQFYDLIKDPFEKNNLIYSDNETITEKINKYKSIYNNMEIEAISVQEEYLLKKIQGNITKYINSNFIDKIDYILIIGFSNYAFLKMFINCSKKVFKDKHFTIIVDNKSEDANDEICGDNMEVININDYNNKNTISEIIYNKYNLAFVLSDSNSKKEFEGYRYVLNNLECQVLYSDYNCEIYKSLISKRIHFLYKKIKFNKQKYFRNPLYIFVDFMKVLTRKV